MKIKKKGQRGLRMRVTHHTVTFDMLYDNLQTYINSTHQFAILNVHEYTNKYTILYSNIRKTLKHPAFVGVFLNFDNYCMDMNKIKLTELTFRYLLKWYVSLLCTSFAAFLQNSMAFWYKKICLCMGFSLSSRSRSFLLSVHTENDPCISSSPWSCSSPCTFNMLLN